VQVADTNPSTSFTGQLTDVSQVDKFELTPEEYAQRQGQIVQLRNSFLILITCVDTVLAYKQRNRVGRFAPPAESQPSEAAHLVDIPIGSRCQIESNEPGLNKRGTVRFFGKTKFAKGEGVWVGIEYDEPMGKNDGS
jgi:tubulin-folding cofactor B